MLTPDNISVGVRGFAPLLEGQLHDAVDPEASAWIIKDDKRFVPLKMQRFLKCALITV